MLLSVLALFIAGCIGVPEGARPVQDFDIERYTGRWYEIARLDHPFERGLQKVSAEYRLRDDGCIDVINRGYDVRAEEWRAARGKGCFVDERDVGRLKVSFFGPFYASYNVLELDQRNYAYALVAGPDTDYLWILSRSPTLEQSVVDSLTAHADELGFATERLIYVDH